MIDDRDLFERAVRRFAPPDDALERLLTRRDRKRRNQRIAAAVVSIVVALAVALAGAGLLRSERTPADQTPRPLPVGNGEIVMVRGPFWDPDTEPEIVAVDPRTGNVRRLVTCDQQCNLSSDPWSPDGTELLYSSGGSLFSLDMGTVASRAVVSGRSGNAIVSPNGDQIVYDAGNPPTTPTDFYRIERDGGGRTRLDPLAGMNLLWYQWSPDGRTIAYFEHGVYSSDGSIGVLDLAGTPIARTLVSFPRADPCNTGHAPLGCVHSVTMSPVDGRISYATYDPKAGIDTVRVINPDDGTIAVVATWPVAGRPDFLPQRMAWSPDGSRIAYAADCQIWSFAPDGTDPVLVKDLGTCTALPDRLTWSPDGTELAFFVLDRDASGVVRAMTLTVLDLDGGAIHRLETFYPSDSDDGIGSTPIAWRSVP